MKSEKCEAHCIELRLPSQRESEEREANEQIRIQDKGNESGDVQEKQVENGVIGLMGAHYFTEIGYVLLPEYWGKGYATEAL